MQIPSLVQEHYDILQPLGSGGMGTVFQARDVQTSEHVAVKMLKPDVPAHGSGRVQRFARDGQALRTLNRPNIVKLWATGPQDGQHYLAMKDDA